MLYAGPRRPYVLVHWAGLDAAGGRSTTRPTAKPPSPPRGDRPLTIPAPPRRRRRPPAPPARRRQSCRQDARRRRRNPAWTGPALLVARRRLAVRQRRWPLTAWRLLARDGFIAAAVGAARHGGHAARHRLLLFPLGAALACPRHWVGRGPCTPGHSASGRLPAGGEGLGPVSMATRPPPRKARPAGRLPASSTASRQPCRSCSSARTSAVTRCDTRPFRRTAASPFPACGRGRLRG